MVQLKNIKCEYVIHKGDCLPTQDFLAMIENEEISLSQPWFTTKERKATFEADDLIDYMFERIADDGYEAMDSALWNSLSDDQIEAMQILIDDTLNCDAAIVYEPDERITWND